jgi:predicted AlkP superfamily pyrophosphatase or phosphodiesterase
MIKHQSAANGRGVWILLLAFGIALSSCERKVQRTPKALFIIVDGIPADVIEKLDPPALKEISERGGYTRAHVGGGNGGYTQTPTISAVGYNSLLTSTWVNKHNVWDNDIKDQNYHYPSIFRIAEAYDSSLKTAVFSTWTDNRTKLIGEGLPETGKLMLDYKFDGLELDTVKYPHDENADYIHEIDEAVADAAARYIRDKGPDLSWVYLEYTDDMAHRFGDSEQFYKAVRIADSQIGRIWDAIKQREQGQNEKWLIIVTTDHGRDPTSGKGHGGQSVRERTTWIATNAHDLNDRFKERSAIVDIMPSICNFMEIPVPEEVKKEIDGVPFIGDVDFADLRAERNGGKIYLHWKNLSRDPEAKGELWLSATNNFRTGGKDNYRKIHDVRIFAERDSIEVNSGTQYVKILLKGPHHYLNTWIVE